MKAAVYAVLLAGLMFLPAWPASNSRSLTGEVVDKSDNALSGAVVQLENTKTLDVRSLDYGQDRPLLLQRTL